MHELGPALTTVVERRLDAPLKEIAAGEPSSTRAMVAVDLRCLLDP